MNKNTELSSDKLAALAVAALDELKGQAVRSINVGKLTSITDYMVIATGTSSTHVKALADSVDKAAKEAGCTVKSIEGKMQAEWVLVDLIDVVVHIMVAPMRALYNLEDLWSFAPQSPAATEAQSTDSE